MLSVFYKSCLKTFGSHLVFYAYLPLDMEHVGQRVSVTKEKSISFRNVNINRHTDVLLHYKMV